MAVPWAQGNPLRFPNHSPGLHIPGHVLSTQSGAQEGAVGTLRRRIIQGELSEEGIKYKACGWSVERGAVGRKQDWGQSGPEG